MASPDPTTRCPWCGTDPLYVAYHDEEWGVPLRDERRLFELLILEGAQAGLSWLTILRKREGYRRVFEGFDPERMAAYGAADMDRLLADPGIVRNRAKVAAAVDNARALLALWDSGGTLADTLWRHVDGEPRRNAFATMDQVPAATPESEAMSRALKRLGFRFVGPTVCYALMQSAGLVDDHLTSCFRHGAAAAQATDHTPSG
ncbi:DNA-3-methyladenine glycosylase I [uncultured Thiohalocapsa sp.]|uniref:DNA-3-methyladenine glycosylase I n=1 Tax=uncultured Thiohalocapsa sp. TaxID=768990 RepID=UPI0025E45C3A|nr:DNA-3-methyladenine glycosylase I [uncultured Thiohalocapsa sp.]